MKIFVLFQSEQQQQQQQMIWFGERERIILPTPSGAYIGIYCRWGAFIFNAWKNLETSLEIKMTYKNFKKRLDSPPDTPLYPPLDAYSAAARFVRMRKRFDQGRDKEFYFGTRGGAAYVIKFSLNPIFSKS